MKFEITEKNPTSFFKTETEKEIRDIPETVCPNLDAVTCFCKRITLSDTRCK